MYYKRDNNFSPGQVVKIFQKPVTREDYEGEAELVEQTHADYHGDGLEIWMVRFLGEPESTYQRTIYKEA
jgi:hypothetical protein